MAGGLTFGFWRDGCLGGEGSLRGHPDLNQPIPCLDSPPKNVRYYAEGNIPESDASSSSLVFKDQHVIALRYEELPPITEVTHKPHSNIKHKLSFCKADDDDRYPTPCAHVTDIQAKIPMPTPTCPTPWSPIRRAMRPAVAFAGVFARLCGERPRIADPLDPRT